MKFNLRYLVILPAVVLAFACKDNLEHNKAGFEKTGNELIEKFGADAYYTDLEMVANIGSEEGIMVTETKDPASLKQEQWLRYNGGEWEKQADVSFTAEGGDPKLFMFQLNKEVSLSKMGDLLQASQDQLLKEKNVKDAAVVQASVKSNNKMNSKETGIFYYITLRDKANQKDYNFVYDLKGNLKSIL